MYNALLAEQGRIQRELNSISGSNPRRHNLRARKSQIRRLLAGPAPTTQR